MAGQIWQGWAGLGWVGLGWAGPGTAGGQQLRPAVEEKRTKKKAARAGRLHWSVDQGYCCFRQFLVMLTVTGSEALPAASLKRAVTVLTPGASLMVLVVANGSQAK